MEQLGLSLVLLTLLATHTRAKNYIYNGGF